MKTQHDLLTANWGKKVGLNLPYTPGVNLRVDAAVRLLPGGDRHLDLGCGTGLLGEALQGRFGETHGLDLSEVAVASASRRGVRARRWDLETTPYPYGDGAFDAVTLLSVVQYVFDPVKLMAEIRRLLRPGGRVLIGFPNMRALWRVSRLLLGGRFPRVSSDPGYDGGTIRYFCRRDVEVLVVRAGLQVRGWTGVFARPRWLEGRAEGMGMLARLRAEFLCAEIILDGERSGSR